MREDALGGASILTPTLRPKYFGCVAEGNRSCSPALDMPGICEVIEATFRFFVKLPHPVGKYFGRGNLCKP